METTAFTDIPIITKQNMATEQLGSGAFFLFDKPKGWSSFRAVKLLRWASGVKKVGHAGTLDPMATGLLLIGVGKSATKLIDQIQAQSKEYRAVIEFGKATDSYDAEGNVVEEKPFDHITLEKVVSVFGQFVGIIQQYPPIFSAIKKDGKRLYEYARKGQVVELASRQVIVHSITLNGFKLPYLDITVLCSKGTYIRSLAHDMGLAADSCAHLCYLRRTKIGSFSIEDALQEEDIKRFFGKELTTDNS